KDIYQKSHDQARGLKTDRVPIIFINKYFTQFIPGKQHSSPLLPNHYQKTGGNFYLILHT
ncbi:MULTISPECIES: hypothetical protein, partial [unclassified Microcystis]|uniref:hypothetical protein n=1 Tax=unclassified Microcystis TaxID=2643300 RepID=UPI002583BC0C